MTLRDPFFHLSLFLSLSLLCKLYLYVFLLETCLLYPHPTFPPMENSNESLKATIPHADCNRLKNCRMWNISTIWVAWYKWCKMYTWLTSKIAMAFTEETSKLLHLEHSSVRCLHLDTSESRTEIPWTFWNVVLEKNGEDQLDRSCEKRGSITQSQGGKEYPTYNKAKEG
jgi:hypothetical protein